MLKHVALNDMYLVVLTIYMMMVVIQYYLFGMFVGSVLLGW